MPVTVLWMLGLMAVLLLDFSSIGTR